MPLPQGRDDATANPGDLVPRGERDSFVAFAFAAADVLLTLDEKGTILEAQGALRAFFGAAAAQLAGRALTEFLLPADQPLAEAILARAARATRFERAVLSLVSPGRAAFPVVLGGCLVPSLPGRLFASLSIPTPLPAPGNRDAAGLLDAEAFEAAARAATAAPDGRPRTLALLRVRGLDQAAAKLSPERRTRLLARVGGTLRTRAADGDLAGRLGPDSFGVVTAAPLPSEEIAGEIAAIVATHADGATVAASVSAVDLAAGQLSEAGLAQALAYTLRQFATDAAVPPASLSAGLAAAMDGTTSRLDALRRTIRRDEFAVAFQPIVNIDTGHIHHFEALARFPGTTSPGATISFAEEVGVIAEFDLAMTRRVLRQLEVAPRHAIAVNLSARSVAQPGFRRQLLALLAAHGTAASRLVFELTESAMIDDMPAAVDFLRELRRQGHRVCLDDFGAGRAGYGYLRRFEVDYVKIDGAFLRAAVHDRRERAMLRSVIRLGAELGFSVVGEMIETEEEAALARSVGMALGQGYLLGRPAADLPCAPSSRPVAAGAEPRGTRVPG